MVEDRAKAFVSEVEAELRPLLIEANLAAWEASTADSPETREKSKATEARLRVYLSSETRYQRIEQLLDSSELRDPLLRRQLELLALEHRPNLLPTSTIDDLVSRSKQIQSEFYSFRASLDGHEATDNEIVSVLRKEDDVGRRKAAWEASKQIAARVAEPLRELVKRRNDAARSRGYRDFYAMRMELQEIDEEELLRVFTELKDRTQEPFRRAKAEVDARIADRFRCRPEDLRPWHYEDPFFQEPPLSGELGLDDLFRGRDIVAIAEDFYAGIGLPIRDVLDRSDLMERPGKEQHAYCIDIDREGDVRILCNLQDDRRWMGTLLHELGHAAYDKLMPSSLPWLLREPAHIATTEAIAMFMDRLSYDVDWLESAAGISINERDGLSRRTRSALRFQMLLMARWVLVMTFFERQLYANPDRTDLDSLWWGLVEELQMVRRPEDRDAPDWAAKIHLATSPVYYHNYLLGELIASQLAATLRKTAFNGANPKGYVARKEFGDFLRERIFDHGASLHWQALLESATGSRLSPDAFLKEFVSETGSD